MTVNPSNIRSFIDHLLDDADQTVDFGDGLDLKECCAKIDVAHTICDRLGLGDYTANLLVAKRRLGEALRQSDHHFTHA